MKPRKLRAYEKRVETGPVAFGPDWPGIFIRGDNALHYGWTLRNAVVKLTKHPHPSIDPITVMYLCTLADVLQSCAVEGTASAQETRCDDPTVLDLCRHRTNPQGCPICNPALNR